MENNITQNINNNQNNITNQNNNVLPQNVKSFLQQQAATASQLKKNGTAIQQTQKKQCDKFSTLENILSKLGGGYSLNKQEVDPTKVVLGNANNNNSNVRAVVQSVINNVNNISNNNGTQQQNLSTSLSLDSCIDVLDDFRNIHSIKQDIDYTINRFKQNIDELKDDVTTIIVPDFNNTYQKSLELYDELAKDSSVISYKQEFDKKIPDLIDKIDRFIDLCNTNSAQNLLKDFPSLMGKALDISNMFNEIIDITEKFKHKLIDSKQVAETEIRNKTIRKSIGGISANDVNDINKWLQ